MLCGMVTYPCPFCGAPAAIDSGCSGCGRPPYPDAAEVVRLNARATELLTEVETARGQFEEARGRYGAAVQRLNAVRAQRNLLAPRVGQAVAATRTPSIPQAAPAHAPSTQPHPGQLPALQPAPQPAPQPGQQPGTQAEAHPRTVQNALFILGGLLLGSAAIV